MNGPNQGAVQAAQIARFKTEVWQNAAIAQIYQRNVYADSFHITLKNLREVSLCLEFAHGRVLDAGCGTGRFTIPIHDAGLDVVGMDVSADMLGVARASAEGRPITWVQGSVFNLPFPDASFDTIVSITVVPHFPQWEAILREYARVLRPGGTMIFNMCSQPHTRFVNRNGAHYGNDGHPGDPNYFQVETDGHTVKKALEALGLVMTHVLPSDVFNGNEVLKEFLGNDYEATLRELNEAFSRPGAIELWQFIEHEMFRHLPVAAAYGFLVIAQSSDTRPAPWTPPPEHSMLGARLDAAELRNRMGSAAFERFRLGLEAFLQEEGAVRLLALLGTRVLPRLPVTVDFLSVLSPSMRRRILTHVAWEWAQNWHRGMEGGVFAHHGLNLAPMMEYEALDRLTRVLEPLARENA